jgi:UDP-N-acetyl-D-glucosamine dehydrogenase
VGDIRVSPALKILSLLRDLGADVSYHDPHVPLLSDFALTSRPLEEAVADADLVIIVTAHPDVDHDLVARRARLLLDLRGVTRSSGAPNVVRL